MFYQEEAPSVPYDEALKVRNRADACALKCQTLTQQLVGMQTQISNLERKSEEWRQLYELQQLKTAEVSRFDDYISHKRPFCSFLMNVSLLEPN